MATGFPVLAGDEQGAAVYNDETSSPTTVITRKSVPAGASYVELGLFPSTNSAPTAKFLFVVVNAASDSEEDFLIATPSARICIPVGEMQRIMFPESDPCTRYAFASDAATESVGTKCIQRVGGLV